jgi:molybdopterin synthase catalytic subunit
MHSNEGVADNNIKRKSHCFGCQNKAHEAPLSSAQCYPASQHLCATASSSDECLSLVTNNEGVAGAAFLEITDRPIDVSFLTSEYAACDACGAIATFLGVTRNHFHGRPVARLEYEAFTSMALKQMSHIVRRIFLEFAQVHRVIISHRIGVVPVKEASVFIAVTTEHRESGLSAVAFAINTLKERVPVWKREFYVAQHPSPSSDTPTQSAVESLRCVDGEEEQSVWKRNCEYSSPTAPLAPPLRQSDGAGATS